tara:strand:+ start:373 stop:1443 length:1071 start_codon:yes stop_codon:yes gene_type:complete
MKEKIFLLLLSTLVTIFTIEILSKKIVSEKLYRLNYNERVISFYNHHYKNLHHLSVHPKDAKDIENLSSLIFRKIGKGSKKILVHGDSWSEQFEIEESKKSLLKFSKIYDLQFILAGNSSYSFSPLTAQLTKLRDEFNIYPDFIILVVDQTDIGDELCRYKNLRYKHKGKISVKPDPVGTTRIYSIGNYIERCKILNSNGLAIKNLIDHRKFMVETTRNAEKDVYPCGIKSILKYLEEGLSNKNKNYMVGVINDYIENVFASHNLKKLFIISHPHRKHITNEYKLDIKDLVYEVLNFTYHKDSIIFINQFDSNNFNNLDHVFVKGDESSHLNNKYFIEKFLEQTLKALELHIQIIG